MKIAGKYYRVRWLRLLYALAAAILLTALLFDVLAPVHGPPLRAALGSLMVLALLVLIFVAVRLVRFQIRAYNLLRRVLSGDYEAGIETSGFLNDEIAELEHLLNRFVQQVRQYDDLRSGRIRQLRMTLDSVLQHSREAIGLLDV
jgi:HAMP domain-containing protein